MDGGDGSNDSRCQWCGETITATEEKRSLEYFCGAIERFHFECQARMILGSVAHIERRCSCFIKGASDNDPPNMTKREAARAAVTTFERLHPRVARRH